MHGSAHGGNDTLKGGDNSGSGFVDNRLLGDAEFMDDSTHGGNDRLISGINASDEMWGDAKDMSNFATGGNDTFVFVGAFGNDFVGDFRQGEDKIEFQVAGVDDFGDLFINAKVISTAPSFTDTVTLVGFNGTLTAGDFVFS